MTQAEPLEGAVLAARARELLSVRLPVNSVIWELGIQQKEIAELAGLPVARVSRVLQGAKEARKQGAVASAKVYGAVAARLGIELTDLAEYQEAFTLDGDKNDGAEPTGSTG